MPVDDQKLMQGLVSDLADAKGRVAATPGPANPMDYFEPKALRVQGKVMGQKEMAQAKRAIEKVADELVNTAGRLNDDERFKARMAIQRRLRDNQMMLMKQAAAVQRYIKQRGLDQEQQQALWQAVGMGAQGIGSVMVGGWGDNAKLQKQQEMMSGGDGTQAMASPSSGARQLGGQPLDFTS